MKRAIKILAAILIVALIAVIIFLKTAVGDKSIYISTGFDKDVMIKVDNTTTLKSEVVVYLTDMVGEYEDLFGETIWNESIEGIPFEDYIISQIKNNLTRLKCMNEMAISRGIVLSNQEGQNIQKAADEYVSGLDKSEASKKGINAESVALMYRTKVLADKLFDDLTYEVDTEISEDEARVITIQYIKCDTEAEAVSLKTRLDEGTSFSSILKEKNTYEYQYELRRGEMEAGFEEAAFNLVTGEISQVVSTESGFYIIMCINDYDKNKTATNRETIITQLKLEKFNEFFEKYESSLYAEYNEELWENISIKDRISVNVGFQDAYDKYFK